MNTKPLGASAGARGAGQAAGWRRLRLTQPATAPLGMVLCKKSGNRGVCVLKRISGGVIEGGARQCILRSNFICRKNMIFAILHHVFLTEVLVVSSADIQQK